MDSVKEKGPLLTRIWLDVMVQAENRVRSSPVLAPFGSHLSLSRSLTPLPKPKHDY